jgi:hypothetical protein
MCSRCRPREGGDPYAVSFGSGRADVASFVREPLTSVVMGPRLRGDDPWCELGRFKQPFAFSRGAFASE